MILAAGLGTRLKPLTDSTPKALVPIVNKPIINRTIDYLKSYGVRRIVVNAHHHSKRIVDYLNNGGPFGIEIDVRVEPEILGTGGGIGNTKDFWDNEPFIVINADILTDIHLNKAYERHRSSGGLATLILHDHEPFNQVLIDNRGCITDIGTQKNPSRLAFTGIHVVEPELLSYIPESGFSDIMDCYRRLIRSGKRISAYITEGHYWRDIGNIGSYIQANKDVLGRSSKMFFQGSHTVLHPSVRLSEWAVVGDHVALEQGVEIRRSIIWDHVRVKRGCTITDSIVTSNQEVDGDLRGQIT